MPTRSQSPRHPKSKSTNVRLKMLTTSVRVGLHSLATVAPRLAGRLATRLFTTPRRHRRPEREIDWLAGGSKFIFCVDGTDLQAWTFGEGPTVVLQHGWEGRGSQMGALIQPLVTAGYRVIAFDGPAHGDSQGTTANLADFRNALTQLEEWRGPIYAVVAHSFGAASAALALKEGFRPERLVFIAPGAAPAQAPRYMQRMLGLKDAVIDLLVQQLESDTNVKFTDLETELLFGDHDVPLLVVHDRDDTDVPLADVAKLVAAWPTENFIVTDGLGHRRILREGGVIQATLDFLS